MILYLMKLIWHEFLDYVFEDTGLLEREIVKRNAKDYIQAYKEREQK